MPRSEFVWVCHEESTLEALQGLVNALEGQGSARDAAVRIVTVSGTQTVQVPPGLRDLAGDPLQPRELTVDNLPAGGLLWIEEAEG
jgi:hypothetical protein